jgi:nicotinamide phosphoribosyltransferase
MNNNEIRNEQTVKFMNTQLKDASPMLLTDFYKSIHHFAYVPGLEYLVSYWTPRMTRIENIDKIVMFGMQALIKEHLIVAFYKNFFSRPWNDIEAEYIRIISHTMTKQAADTTELKKIYDLGYLPIEIRAVPEGTRVNVKTPMFEIRNTVKGFGWLVNYLETYISVNIWHPMTAATIAYRYREIVNEYYDKTVVGGIPSSACGDFSMRGMAAKEASYRASAGHLLSFTGTATIPAIMGLEDYYNCDCTKEIVGKGVPSTEHSVMSSYGRDGEFECYRHLIEDVFPDGPLSIVSDTYDYWNVLTNYLPRLKDSIAKRNGKIVIRGDSGNPVDIITGELKAEDYMIVEGLTEDKIKAYFKNKAETDYSWNDAYESWYNVRIGDYIYNVKCYHELATDEDGDSYYSASVEDVIFEKRELTPAEKGTVELLMDVFGYAVNEKGYKVLPPYIGAIYGDSITVDRISEIYKRLADKKIAVSNVTLGIGSFTYQYNTRDTFGFALKATHSIVNGTERQIFKDPITDKSKGNNFKKSQKGLCYVYFDGEDIRYRDELTFEDMENPEYADNMLTPVFRDGILLRDESLATIRNRLHNSNF